MDTGFMLRLSLAAGDIISLAALQIYPQCLSASAALCSPPRDVFCSFISSDIDHLLFVTKRIACRHNAALRP